MSPPGFDFTGRVAIVTGGATGIGAATASLLAGLGADVAIASRKADRLEAKAVEISRASARRCLAVPTDVRKEDQVASLVKRVVEHFGRLDILINNAGGTLLSPLKDVTSKMWEQSFALNVNAAYYCTREAGRHFIAVPHTLGAMKCMLINYIGTRQLTEGVLPAMEDRGGIAIIASVAGMSWLKNLAQNLELLAISDPTQARLWCEAHPEKVRDGYTVSKEMLIVWVQHRAIALGQERSIRLNCTAPCPTRTAFMDEAVKELGQEYLDRFPYPVLGRMATPEEQAWPLILLNSPLNAAVTGNVFYTDQGFAGGLFTGSLDASGIMTGARKRA
jgi:NAD(P)-dependent dehydrogenase (short-subunit alcohol dehydrogenase family)